MLINILACLKTIRVYIMAKTVLNLDALRAASADLKPYTNIATSGVLFEADKEQFKDDYPEIDKPGFFPLETLGELRGKFKSLIEEMQQPEFADLLSEKLNVELRDKPSIITVRRWSALKDGGIHNDGASKIVTALIYLNNDWPEDEVGGKFAVLASDKSFDDAVKEITPSYGMFSAFVRSENSWHGHRPFAGERRVVQIAWLKSQADLERKTKRGKFSFALKNLLNKFKGL